MNNTNNNNSNNDNTNGNYNFFIHVNPYHRLLSLFQESDNACILHMKNIKIPKK